MKTKEFTERVKDLGFVATTYKHGTIRISCQDGAWFSSVDIEKQFDVRFFDHKHITPKIFSLITEYSKTPLEEREEEKKYIVEIKTTDSTLHLWRATDGSGDTDFILKDRTTTGQRLFTKKEIESIDSRFLQFAQFAIEVTP